MSTWWWFYNSEQLQFITSSRILSNIKNKEGEIARKVSRNFSWDMESLTLVSRWWNVVLKDTPWIEHWTVVVFITFTRLWPILEEWILSDGVKLQMDELFVNFIMWLSYVPSNLWPEFFWKSKSNLNFVRFGWFISYGFNGASTCWNLNSGHKFRINYNQCYRIYKVSITVQAACDTTVE